MLPAGAAGAETVTGDQGRGRRQHMVDSGYADFGFIQEQRKVKSGIECPLDMDENARLRASFRKYLLNKLPQLCPALHYGSGPGLTCTVRNLGIGDVIWKWLQKRHTYIKELNRLVLE